MFRRGHPPSGQTKYFYDFAGRLAKFTENRGSHSRRVEYTYTEENQVSQKSEFAGSVRQNTYFRYDDFHRRTQVGTNSTWWKYTYDTLGRVATQRFTVSGADILTETFTYNNANQVTSIQKVTPENTRTHSYTYDDNGNIATVTVGNQTTQYFYDTAGQLIRENNETAGTTTLWTYDNAGNILREKVYNYTADNGTPSQLLEDNDYFYASTDWGDLLIAYNGNFIYYDDTTTSGGFKIGNPTTYYNGKHWDFTWEHGRQLATMFDGTATWTNTYNADGLRTSRTNRTTTYNYYYDGTQLVNVTGGTQNIWIFYDGNRPVIIKYGDTATYHYELNLQGDVIAILDTSGNRVVEYTYDAWGKILSISGSMKDTLGKANPLCYRGYVYDHETGLYYCQSRYYDPEIGRWLNADGFTSTGQGFTGNNMFAYCGNNPISRLDRTGASFNNAFSVISLDAGGNLPDEYIIYYYHPQSSQNLNEPARQNHSTSGSIFVAAGTFEELVHAVNMTPTYIDNVYIYMHGNEDYLFFYGDLQFCANDIANSFDKIDITGNIYLFSCKGGREALASTMASATTCTVIACEYKVSFDYGIARCGWENYFWTSWKYGYMAWYSFSPDGNKTPYSQHLIYTQ